MAKAKKKGAAPSRPKNAGATAPKARPAAESSAKRSAPAGAAGEPIAFDHPETPADLRALVAHAFAPIRAFMDEPLPRGVNFFQTTGSLCIFMATLQILTGVLMAFYYTPSPEAAWESVTYVDEEVTFGNIVHGLHHWGSSGFVVAAFLHMVRVFAFGAYKGRRKATWLLGVALFGVVLGFGFTGYLLPWDMKGYFGTKVGTSIVGYAPVVGPPLKTLLLGGSDINEFTLPRFYAIHVLVLPGALIALMAAHLYLVRLYGITPPWKRDDEKVDYTFRFFPDQALRDSLVMLIALSILLLLAWTVGGNLEPKADPTDASYAPHPEWYFLGLQQLLHYFGGDLQIVGTTIIPGVALLLMIALPFIDRNPERRLSRRPIAATVLVLGVGTIVVLTVLGARALERERAERLKMAAAMADEASEGEEPAAADPEAAAVEPPATATVAADGTLVFDDAAYRLGAELYELHRCDSCHVGEGVGTGKNIPPSLEYAGARFQSAWLVDYMDHVEPRRYDRKGRRPLLRMPKYNFNEEERRAIAAHLSKMSRPDLFEGMPTEFRASTAEKIALGEELYEAEGCGVCHALDGEGGLEAPDLTGVGKALTPRFLYAIVKHPETVIPDMAMMDSLLEDEEIEALTYFLMTK